MGSVPEFSVITPTHQGAAFIPRCHWSLAQQELADWEWILIDDASSDKTESVVRGLDDPRIRYHRLGGHRGPGYARNHALQMAKAPWAAILDVDDLSFPDRLTRARDARQGGFDFLCSPMALIDRNYAVLGVRGISRQGYPRSFPHATLCGQTNLLRQIGYPIYARGQDQTMVLTLANAHRGQYSEAPTYICYEAANATAKRALYSHYYLLKQLRQLASDGVLERGPALRRAQRVHSLKLIALLPMFAWPNIYKWTLRWRPQHPGQALEAERRNFISRCKELFPLGSDHGSGP